MADAYTLPADLFIPEAAQEYIGFEFYSNLGVLDVLTSLGPLGDRAPIRITNFDVLSRGGQYVEQPVFKQISSLATRRNYASGGSAVDTLKLEGRNDIGVQLAVKLGPVALTGDAAIVSLAQEGGLEMEFARQAARSFREYVQTAVVLAAKAAITNMTSSAHTHDVWNATDRTNLSPLQIAKGKQKMGDRLAALSAMILRSESWYDLFSEQAGRGTPGADLASAEGNVSSVGLAWQVADEAALTTADAGFDKAHALLLGPGFIELDMRGFRFYAAEERLDTESVHQIVRGDAEFVLRVPGMQWDKTNGGANPTNDTSGVGLSTNWDPTYTDAREVNGVLVTANSALLS